MIRLLACLTVVALLSLAPVAAQDAPPLPDPHITVIGSSLVERQPDHATVAIGVTARGATAAAAIDETSTTAARIVEAARAFGIAVADIQTGYVALAPAYRNVRAPSGAIQQQPDGYQASSSIQIRLRDLSRLGEFMRRGVGEGATRIGDISFGLLDRSAAEREANAAAMVNARDQAETLAAAAGVKLGRLQEIKPVSRPSGPVRARRLSAARVATAPDIPIEPGNLEIAAEVEVTWSIAQP